MFKKRFFTIILILISLLLFITAATCSMCGVELTDESGQTQNDQSNTEGSANAEDVQGNSQPSGQSSQVNNGNSNGNNQDPDSNNGNSQPNDGNNNGQQANSIEITGIVVGDVVDEHVEPAPFLFTDSTYTCYPVMTDPAEGTETYSWSVTGGSNDDGAFYMQWNTPSDEGLYTISVTINRGDSWDSYNEEFYIETETAMGSPLEGPQITGIEVMYGNDTFNNMNLDKDYKIEPLFHDPNLMIAFFSYEVDQGTILGVDNNILRYRSPDYETDVNITVIAKDPSNLELIRETFTVSVRPIDFQ